jgi:hypothetical protein
MSMGRGIFLCFVALGLVLSGCARIREAAPGEPPAEVEAPPAEPEPETSGSEREASGEVRPIDEKPGAQKPALEVVLSGRRFHAFAIGASKIFTLESDVRTRLVSIDKSPPHAIEILIEEDILDGVRFEGVGAARGRVYVVDSYGAMRSALEDGTDLRNEDAPGSSTRILSSPSSQTLWLADLPRFLGDRLTFHWWGLRPEDVPWSERQLVPSGTVGDVVVDDEALVYTTRGSVKSLRHWAPAATGATKGDRLLASLPETPGGVALDAVRAYVHLPATREVRGYDRATGDSTTVVLAGTEFDAAPQLRSDGHSMYFLTPTALRRCELSRCAGTMTLLATNLTSARALVLDGAYAWIVTAPQGAPGIIARVSK